jgi:aminomethyltransferase
MVSGRDAAAFLQRATANDLEKLKTGRAQLSLLLSDRGTVIDDLLVYRLGDDRFLLVVNAANAERDAKWLRELQLRFGLELALEDQSDATALIALQGPRSPALLQGLTDLDLAGLRSYSCGEGRVDGRLAMVARTGYTGEDGFEIFLAPDDAEPVWQRLVDGGAVPAGLAARDILRLEAGMMLCGQDMDDTTTPFEVGLDWVVKLDKRVAGGNFVGRQALLEQRARGVPRATVGLALTERGVPRPGCGVKHAGRACGLATSGTWSPTLERGIALARVDAGQASGPGPFGIEIRGKDYAATRVDLPFYRRPKVSS